MDIQFANKKNTNSPFKDTSINYFVRPSVITVSSLPLLLLCWYKKSGAKYMYASWTILFCKVNLHKFEQHQQHNIKLYAQVVKQKPQYVSHRRRMYTFYEQNWGKILVSWKVKLIKKKNLKIRFEIRIKVNMQWA